MAPVIGPEVDVPAPDVNTTPEIMAWMTDEYMKLTGDKTRATFTGKPIEVGGKPAHYIEMLPDERDAKQQAILGVVLYDAEQAWFFKMMGDAKLVESERDAFRKFVTSSKVAGPKVD